MKTFDPKVIIKTGDYILESSSNIVCGIDENVSIEISGMRVECNLTRDLSKLTRFKPFAIDEETMGIDIVNPHLITSSSSSGKIFIGMVYDENDEERELCIEFILSPCLQLNESAVMICVNIFTKILSKEE